MVVVVVELKPRKSQMKNSDLYVRKTNQVFKSSPREDQCLRQFVDMANL